jgi:small subunit ribosomal protein S20
VSQRKEDTLANTASAKKRIRQNEKRRVHNKLWRTRARTYTKRARTALESDNKAEAVKAVHEAIRELDKAAAKGIIHRRNADRRKSRLMKQLAMIEPSA